ncbi:hypothetical protein Aduo_000888 [Ancylostoma duodenale]
MAAAANLLTLRDFTLISSWTELAAEGATLPQLLKSAEGEWDREHSSKRCVAIARSIVRRDWLVVGIQDGTKLVFVEVTDDRSAANLDAIIQRHAIPGGVIRTNMWRGYSNLTNLGYIHETVNHYVNFVHPVTGVHTHNPSIIPGPT